MFKGKEGISMKKTLQYIALIIFISFNSFIGFSQITYAEEDKNAGGATGFIYEIKKPENQKQDIGYFDLRMNPDQKQTVQIILKNPTDQEITVEVSLNGAKTNMNGVIEYGPTNLKKDASLKYDFTDIVKAPEKVTIPAQSEKNLDIAIAMPQASIDGKIVGGIQLKKADTKEEKEKQKGANVVNKYAYVIAMVLTENDTEVQPNLELNKVYAGQANYRNVVYTDLSNVEANFLDNLSIETQIMSEKNDEVIYETKKASMRMAPNSNMTFPTSMDGEKMVAGKYRAHILATSGDRKWEWTEDFEITNEEADKFNRSDLGLVQEKGINWVVIVGIAVGIFALILIVFFIIRAIRKNSEKTRKNEQRKNRQVNKK
ncbi:hypothetical protein RV18_GL001094 [Enterococcus termitis]|nr:hypothetical protein RV18_GL001094 [Enterococcus termitis]